MSIKPLIGITMDYVPAGKMAGAQIRLHAGYADSVIAAGGMPVFLAPCDPEELDGNFLGKLDGLILAGSPCCIDPKHLKQEQHPSIVVMPNMKWQFDVAMAQRALAWNIPTLAIANGYLILNHCAGGETHAYLITDLPKAMPHKDITGGPHRHSVDLMSKSLLNKIYAGDEIRVNSYHTQAIKTVGKRLKATAHAPDGVIEGIESVDPAWWCVGVQWHPHSETANALDINLFKQFVESSDRNRDGLDDKLKRRKL